GLTAAGVELGADLAPFVASWDPAVAGYAVLTLAAVAGSVLLAPRLLSPTLGPAGFAAASIVLALAMRLALGIARTGPGGLDQVFDTSFEAKNEYLPSLPAIDVGGLGWFLDRFAELVPALPVHSAGHPPGMLVALHAAGIDSPEGMAALTIAAGALTAPLTYWLARNLLDESQARLAAILFAFSTSAILHAAASADALFALISTLAAALLLASAPLRAAGAMTLAIASFFSYASLGVGAWAALVVARRDGIRSALVMSGACAVALVAFYAALHALTGFDPLGAIKATEEVYRVSLARIRPYEFWVFGSPTAFLVALGLPITWYAARAAGERQSAALALAAVLVISALLGFSKAETERIWLFLAPLACVAAAQVLPRERLGLVLWLLAAQALATELALDTIW
ncbi:MAG: hypothetical protein H0T15_01830, partial [Thermoleophilaceae bacterium]|nr:hypothetical protein [Thermoleophilaceae bacterium]